MALRQRDLAVSVRRPVVSRRCAHAHATVRCMPAGVTDRRAHPKTRTTLQSLVLMLALAAPCGTVHGATAGPASFNVAATVAAFCTVSATNVGFGGVNAGVAATNTAGRVRLTCNRGVTVPSVALNNGANNSGTQKRMRNAVSGDFLNYQIDRPTGATFLNCPVAGAGPEWNATNTIAATPLFTVTGGVKQIRLCASIPAAQYPSAGSYSDTVQVTATYN